MPTARNSGGYIKPFAGAVQRVRNALQGRPLHLPCRHSAPIVSSWKRTLKGADKGGHMNIRQLLLDVDKAVARPSVLEIAEAVDRCRGVEAVNITVEEIDIETVGMNVTIEGDNMDYDEVTHAIESTGAVVHSLDQIAIGARIIPRIPRVR